MNNSGMAISEVMNFFKLDVTKLTVIHDELDLKVGKIKLKNGGGSAGHNGLKSIDQHVGQNYLRLRIGIDRPQNTGLVAKYVLSDFSIKDKNQIDAVIKHISTYFEKLANDVIGIADAFGIKNFQLIGHDWGSAIGWAVVGLYPERVKSWTAMSVPHLKAFSDAVRFDKKQKKMSQYMAIFQWRGIPEWFLLKKDRQNLRKVWKKSSPEELQDYLDVIGNKPALKASLSYYRANYKLLKKGQKMDEYLEVNTSTLMLWGKKDIAIGPVGVEGTAQYMKGPYERIDLDAGHWLMQEAFEECAKPISAHLAKYK